MGSVHIIKNCFFFIHADRQCTPFSTSPGRRRLCVRPPSVQEREGGSGGGEKVYMCECVSVREREREREREGERGGREGVSHKRERTAFTHCDILLNHARVHIIHGQECKSAFHIQVLTGSGEISVGQSL